MGELERQFMEWITTTFDNMPIIVFLALAIWDMRKHLYRCISRDEQLLDQLISRVIDDK